MANLIWSSGEVKSIDRVLDEQRLPIILQRNMTTEQLNSWITKRKIPENREGLEEAHLKFGNFENFHCMFSLSDQYWFQHADSENWDDLNFFNNRYAEDPGDVFFTPWSANKARIRLPSPDMTTNGVLRKRWHQDEDGISWLIKAGSHKFGQQPITELLASILLRKLKIKDLPFVNYELTVEGMQLCSRSRNFVTEDTEFVPAAHIYFKKPRSTKESIRGHFLDMCREYGIKDAESFLESMNLIDFLIGNPDRHLGNFGFLRNTDGRIIGFAPLFDFGKAYKFSEGSNLIGTARLEVQRDMLERMMAKVDINALCDHQEMFDLIDMYPEINSKRRAGIKRQIIFAEKEVANVKGRGHEKTL